MALQSSSYIRIVPVHTPELAAAPAPVAQLTYRGGPLLSAVELFTVFWGAGWPDQEQLMADVNAFFDYVLASALMDQLAEYSIGGFTIGHGRRTGTTAVTASDAGPSLTDAAIQALLQDEIKNNSAFPQPGPDTLFFVYLPSGTAVDLGGLVSCRQFCGYHDASPAGYYYAVMPAPDCAGCLGGLDAFAALTATSSHELCEAVTDPVPGQRWYDDANGEIGDICAWHTKPLGPYIVQLEWSNQAGACV